MTLQNKGNKEVGNSTGSITKDSVKNREKENYINDEEVLEKVVEKLLIAFKHL